MSRKGNCLDNAPMENFFGLLKQEMFYGEEFKNYQHLQLEIERYIKWFNEDRRKNKLNGWSPKNYSLITNINVLVFMVYLVSFFTTSTKYSRNSSLKSFLLRAVSTVASKKPCLLPTSYLLPMKS